MLADSRAEAAAYGIMGAGRTGGEGTGRAAVEGLILHDWLVDMSKQRAGASADVILDWVPLFTAAL